MGGIQDAIGYECPAYARKFRTEEEALRFIQTRLPEWGRSLHRAVGFTFADFTWEASLLSHMLWFKIPIPDYMLEPTVGRFRLWRR